MGVVINKGKGGGNEILSLQKRECGNSLSHAEGGRGPKGFEVVSTWELEVLAIWKVPVSTSVHFFKVGAQNVLSCFEGGGGAQTILDL